MPRKLRPDMWLFGAVVLLLSAGVVMVYSASAIVAADRLQDPYLFLKKQLVWALLGAGCLLVALRIDYRRLERLGWPILLAAGVLLVLVLVPPLAQPINGTRRWLRLGPISFQPAELAKLALVIYLAGYLTQKLFYLPEAHTDFIFAVIGEELGFLGAMAIIALFAVLVWRGLRVGLRAPDPFGAYLALGITVLIATQTLVNLGVVTGALPTKGMPLPFISFGGSALLVTMAGTGVLLNISQHAHV